MRRWSDPVVWMVAVFWVLGACAPQQEEPQKAPIYDPAVMQQQPAASEPQPAPEPIKIGALFSVTGGAAWLGEPEKNSALLAVDEINAKGGINGRKIELIVEDTEGDDTKGVLAAKKLIGQDKVIAIVGPSRSGTSMAVVPIATENEVPLISCAAAASIAIRDASSGARLVSTLAFSRSARSMACASWRLVDRVEPQNRKPPTWKSN